jgi:hypothetical protein
MLEFVKSLLAMIFSVALILSQAVGSQNPGNQRPEVPKCCGHCEMCRGQCCCAGKNDSTPTQAPPAVPAHSLSQIDWQFSPSIVINISAEAQPESLPFRAFSFSYPSVAAPLYQRNCSYII